MDKSNKYSAENPERIRNWVKENIHMVWDAVKKLQTIPTNDICLRITFYKGSFPIVMQWHKISEIKTFISEEEWVIDSDLSSINAFADWVDKVR